MSDKTRKADSLQDVVGLPWVSVAARITIDEALRVVFAETIHNADFDADRWCAGTAKDLIAAGEMINRELQRRRKPNGGSERRREESMTTVTLKTRSVGRSPFAPLTG